MGREAEAATMRGREVAAEAAAGGDTAGGKRAAVRWAAGGVAAWRRGGVAAEERERATGRVPYEDREGAIF
eukprot:5820521-Prymnesium_polylepis.2